MSNVHPITVLVTGAGSELAFTVIKACHASSLPLRLVASDIGILALGLYWADASYLVPPVGENPDGYLAALREIVQRENVNVIIPTPDRELSFLPAYSAEFLRDFNCHILIDPPEEIERFNDKWLAHQWYASHDLPAPDTARADDRTELADFLARNPFPVILKPRQGGGSRSIFLARDGDELERYLPAVPRPLVQEYLDHTTQEYTAGTYRTRDEAVYSIVLLRELKFGMTNKATVVEEPRFAAFCERVILATNLEGVNNIQFRDTANGPKILEINARCSSTTGIRAHFGFNEPEMFIRERVLGETVPPPQIRRGTVLRYMHEEYVDPSLAQTFTDLRQTLVV